MKNILVNALIKVEDFIEQESNLNRRNFNMTNKQEIYAGFEAHPSRKQFTNNFEKIFDTQFLK